MDNNHLNLESVNKFESMLKTNSILFFDSNEFEEITMYYIDMGNISLAKKANDLSLNQYPDSVSLNLITTEILLLENDLKKAEQIVNQLYEIEPLNPEIIFQKSKVFSKKKQHHKSIECLKQIKTNSDLFYESLVMIGKEYLFIDDFYRAKKAFVNCLKINENDLMALNNVLFCFDSLGNVNKTITFLNNYLESNPYCEICWHHLGKQYVKINKPKKALAAFEFAIIADESFEGAYIETGKLLEGQQKLNEAIEKYEVSLGLSGPTPYTLYRIARCYEKLFNYDIAYKYFSKVIDVDPLHSYAWMKISKELLRKRKYSFAKKFILKSLDIEPENKEFWDLYLKICVKIGSYDEIKYVIDKTVSINDNNINSLINLTKIFVDFPEKKIIKLFKGILLKAYKSSEVPEFNYLLSVLNFKLKKDLKGYDHLRAAYSKHPKKYDFYKAEFKEIPNIESFKNIF